MRRRLLAVLGLTLALSTLLAAHAGATPAPDKAAEVLRHLAGYLAANDSLALEASLSYAIKVDGETEALSTDFVLQYKRPGKIKLMLKNAEIEIHFLSDGENYTTYIPSYEKYTVEDALSASEIVLQSGFGPITAATVLMAELVKEKPFENYFSGESTASYEGLETVDRRESHHLRLAQDELAWDVWVDAGRTPVLRRALPDMSSMEAQLRQDGYEVSLRVNMATSEWSADYVEDDTFSFQAPRDAVQVASFQPDIPQPEAMQILGQPAPDFTLELMDGGRLIMSEKKDKEIVILDFWATWCGPCRYAMPIINRVAKSFADKGVVLYAVNLQEIPEAIRPYLESEKLDVIVALDTDGTVADLFKADAIPQTVIVGKDGIIEVVHVGVSPGYEEEITRQLTALTKGEKLAPR